MGIITGALRGAFHRRMRPQQRQRLGVQPRIPQVGVEQLEQPGVAGIGGLPHVQRRERVDVLAQLIDEGLVERTSARAYAVGARMWELGELSPLALRLRERCPTCGAMPFVWCHYKLAPDELTTQLHTMRRVNGGRSPEREDG